MIRSFLYISLTLFITVLQGFGQGESLLDDTYVHEIRVTFDSENFWSALTDDYLQNHPDVPYRMAAVTIDGVHLDSVGIRQKGFSSHFTVSGLKKSLKIDFNHFVSTQVFDGLKKVNLNNGVGDPAMQRDKLSYDLMNRIGVPAPRVAYANVYLNDEYWGLYTLVEQVDRTFIDQTFEYSKGNLFKNIGFSTLNYFGSDTSTYQQMFELKTGHKPGAWDDFVSLMDMINNTSDDVFAAEINDVFDVERYLRVLVVDVATSNWDSYIDHGRNFYLYQDDVTKKFHWIPWDYNLAIGGTFGPGGIGGGGGGVPQDTIENPAECFSITSGQCPYPATDSIFIQVINEDNFCCHTGWDEVCQASYDQILAGTMDSIPFSPTNIFPVDMSGSEKVLVSRLMQVPSFRTYYYRLFCDFLESHMTIDRLYPLIDQYGDLIREYVEQDPNYIWTMDYFDADLDQGSSEIVGLKRFFDSQSHLLTEDLSSVYDCDQQVSIGALDLVVNELMADNDSLSGIADSFGEYDDWIELYNNTGTSIDLSNVYLSDDRSNFEKWKFPIGTTIGANDFLIVWADNNGGQGGLHTNFRLDKDGESLVLSQDGSVLDSLSYGPQEQNLTYSRIPNGTGDFVIKDPTFGFDNEATTTSDSYFGEVRIFPNPAHGVLNVEIEGHHAGNTSVVLINNLGQVMRQRSLTDIMNVIDIMDLPAGMYYCMITDEAGVLVVRKISIL